MADKGRQRWANVPSRERSEKMSALASRARGTEAAVKRAEQAWITRNILALHDDVSPALSIEQIVRRLRDKKVTVERVRNALRKYRPKSSRLQ